ncbi:MAG: heavy-metal-associated domain-containing protein [Coriobacteriia bacterium]|nr:heavy-metal-associated domain-containing protein [Coriobacteriia bacterium]
MNNVTLNVGGMHCSSCSMLVTMNLEDLDGVQSVDCNHATGVTQVAFDNDKTNVDAIIKTITESGYTAELAQ